MKQSINVLFILAVIASLSACAQKSNSKTGDDEMTEQTVENKEMNNDKFIQLDEAINQYISRDKFAETSDYPGVGNEELRKPMNEMLNILARTFQKIAHQQPDEKLYQTAIKQILGNMENIYLDSEDQDQFCRSIEALMDIVGLESSGGLLNKWRYGFNPEPTDR